MDSETLYRAISEGHIRLKPNDQELSSKKGSMKLRFIHKLPQDMIQRGRMETFWARISTCFYAVSTIML